MLQRTMFISSIALLYVATIGLVGYLFSPAPLFATATSKTAEKPRISHKPEASPRFVVISGKPVRITIPEHDIDLPIDEGIYADDGSWTLSDAHAQFAVMSAQANNHTGNTFVYGHATDKIFGKLNSRTPPPDTLAQLHTDNGQVFSYKFQESHSVVPDDTSILDDTATGPPRLTIQTCTGIWNEWRTMFVFGFEKVDQARK